MSLVTRDSERSCPICSNLIIKMAPISPKSTSPPLRDFLSRALSKNRKSGGFWRGGGQKQAAFFAWEGTPR